MERFYFNYDFQFFWEIKFPFELIIIYVQKAGLGLGLINLSEINFLYYNFYFGGRCYIQNLDLNALK